MKISKTLFKLLTRCYNAASLYDMYINKNFNDVTSIFGIDINALKKINDELLLTDVEEEIFNQMFDSNTGEDLTNISSAQLIAFKETFSEVEALACKQIEYLFDRKVISSKNTYEQKEFKFSSKGNTYHCYLDAYFEEKDNLNVFEVKATTSSKFNNLEISIDNTKQKVFKKDNSNIYRLNIDKASSKEINKLLEILLDRYSSCGKYIYDISIERFICENSFIEKNEIVPNINYYLVVLNSDYCYKNLNVDKNLQYPEVDGEYLFNIYDLNYITSLFMDKIKQEKIFLEESLKQLNIEHFRSGKCCEYKKTTQCKFFNICNNKLLEDGSIADFMNNNRCFKEKDNGKLKTYSLFDLLNKGIYRMEDAASFLYDINQKIQLECYLNNKQYIDLNRIKKAIDLIEYPIYHLDFESCNNPLPRYFLEHPYQQSVFQYSLHIEKKPGVCDLIKDHKEYVAKDHNDHRRELAEKLIKDIDLSNGGSVLVYNENFEKQRLKELAYIFPDLKSQLMNIHDHVFDLLNVIKGNKKMYEQLNIDTTNLPSFAFYDKNLHGSFSIKKVLPIFTNLTYSTLNVKNGTEAILAYMKLATLSGKEYDDLYNSLRVYCRQDTFAMVKILEGLRKLVDKK